MKLDSNPVPKEKKKKEIHKKTKTTKVKPNHQLKSLMTLEGHAISVDYHKFIYSMFIVPIYYDDLKCITRNIRQWARRASGFTLKGKPI